MSWPAEAVRSVVRRRARCRTPGVRDAFDALVERLRQEPRFVPPDRRTVWKKPFPDIPNHRHTDLPGAWRCAWTIARRGAGEVVIILFLGTHGEYEETYGFRDR